MRFALAISACLWTALATAAPLRFMTYNIWGDYFQNPPGERLDPLVKSIELRRPDVLSLQEVTPGWWRSGLFEKLAAMGYEAIKGDMAEAWVRAGGEKGKARCNYAPLVYRKARLEVLETGVDVFHLALTGSKMATWAVFEEKASHKRFIAFATHFWWKGGDEANAVREMDAMIVLWRLSKLRRKWGRLPALCGGDLNCNIHSTPMGVLMRGGFIDSDRNARQSIRHRSNHGNPVRAGDGTWSAKCREGGADDGDLSIDRILFTEGIAALRHEVCIAKCELGVSDHQPVILDFELEGALRPSEP